MRVFAWGTAGWFNFEKMVWDWCGLDEQDLRTAIQWQVDGGEIDDGEAEKRLAYLARYIADPNGSSADQTTF
jgi:hypothetical protein